MPRPPDVANPGCGTGARGNTIQVDHHEPREDTPADLKKQDSCAPDQERHPPLWHTTMPPGGSRPRHQERSFETYF
jgi:hypothetical protein